MSAASGGNSEPKQGQRSQSARGFCPRSTMRVPQPDIIEHFGNADAVPQLPERCLSRKAGIVRCCPRFSSHFDTVQYDRKSAGSLLLWRQSGFAFPVHIAQVNAVCQNAARKAGVRRCTGCAGFVTIRWTLQWMQWAAGQRGRCIRDHAALTCRFPFCRIILLL